MVSTVHVVPLSIVLKPDDSASLTWRESPNDASGEFRMIVVDLYAFIHVSYNTRVRR